MTKTGLVRVGRDRWARQPWKNGGGVTHEIWREGDGAPGFAWRLSAAEVATDGPFSIFEGVDRTLLLLEGAGLVLTRDDGAEIVLREVGQPFAFAGEERWACRLVAGPTLDLNLMVARAAASAELEVVALGPDAPRMYAGERVIALALDPDVTVSCEEEQVTLGRFEAVVAAGQVALGAGAPARVVVIRVRPGDPSDP